MLVSRPCLFLRNWRGKAYSFRFRRRRSVVHPDLGLCGRAGGYCFCGWSWCVCKGEVVRILLVVGVYVVVVVGTYWNASAVGTAVRRVAT